MNGSGFSESKIFWNFYKKISFFSESIKILEKENSQNAETLSKQKELIEKLEDDLLRVNSFQRPEAIVSTNIN